MVVLHAPARSIAQILKIMPTDTQIEAQWEHASRTHPAAGVIPRWGDAIAWRPLHHTRSPTETTGTNQLFLSFNPITCRGSAGLVPQIGVGLRLSPITVSSGRDARVGVVVGDFEGETTPSVYCLTSSAGSEPPPLAARVLSGYRLGSSDHGAGCDAAIARVLIPRVVGWFPCE